MRDSFQNIIFLFVVLFLQTLLNFSQIFAQCDAIGGFVTTDDSSRCIGEATLLTLNAYDGDITWQSSPAGLNTWSAVTTDTSRQVYVYPTENTDYRAHVTIPGCNDAFSTIVGIEVLTNGLPSATGYSQDECGTFFSIHAESPTGVWSKKYGAGNAVFSPSANNTDPDVTIDTFGLFVFIWTDISGGCAAANITNYPQNTAVAIDSIYHCWAGSKIIQMEATPSNLESTGIWTPESGSVTITNATSPNALIEPSNVGTYKVRWTETYHTCSDDTIITIFNQRQPTATISEIPAVCDSVNTLLATDTWGTVNYWQQTTGPGTLSFDNNLAISTGVIADEYGEYIVSWTTENQFCSDTDTVILNFYEQPITMAVEPDDACGINARLDGYPSAKSGTVMRSWNWVSGAGNINSILPITDTSAIAEILPGNYGNYTFRWKEVNGICSDSIDVSLTYYEQPIAIAGQDIDSCGLSVQLSALSSVSGSSGIWSVVNCDTCITFSDITSNNSFVNSISYSGYDVIWTETNAICTSNDTMSVEFIQIPTAFAGISDSICGLEYQLGAVRSIPGSTISWTYSGIPGGMEFSDSTSLNSFATAAEYLAYELTLTETNRICSSSDQIEILFIEVPSAMAGADDNVCGLEYGLSATHSIAGSNGFWSEPGGNNLDFEDSTSMTTSVISDLYQAFNIVWTETNLICSDADTLTIDFIEIPVADAGLPDSTCGYQYLLTANQSIVGSTGFWSALNDNDTIFISNGFIASANVNSSGIFSFLWTEANRTCTDNDNVEISFFAQPDATVLTAEDVCGVEQIVTVSEFGENTAAWSLVSGNGTASFEPDGSSNRYIIEVSDTGNYSFSWNVFNSMCSDDTIISITFSEEPIIDAGPNSKTCGLSTILHPHKSVGEGSWSQVNNNITVNFEPINDTTYRLVSDNYGTVNLRWQVVNGACLSVDHTNLAFIEVPDARTTADTQVCGAAVNLIASPDTNGFWSVLEGPGNLEFSPGMDAANVTVTAQSTGTYNLYWIATNNICSDSSLIEIQFIPLPIADAGEDLTLNNVFEAELQAGGPAENETGTWTLLSGTGDLLNENSPVSVVRNLSLGDNIFDWTVTNNANANCTSSESLIITVLDIIVPEVITPNGDNENDVFFITGIENISPVEISVFNRWGIEVFYSADYGKETDLWDGTNKNGDELTNDTYFYVVDVGGKRTLKGFVVIKK